MAAIIRKLSRPFTNAWRSSTGEKEKSKEQPKNRYKGTLYEETVSSNCLPKAQLQAFLLEEFKGYKDKGYYPEKIEKSDNGKRFTFEVPEELTQAHRIRLDVLRTGAVKPTADDELGL